VVIFIYFSSDNYRYKSGIRMCYCGDIKINVDGTYFFMFGCVLCDGVQLTRSIWLGDHFVKELFLALKAGLLVPQQATGCIQTACIVLSTPPQFDFL